MSIFRKIFPALLLLGAAFQADAKVTLPSFFTDNMVLQRDVPVRIWGWADNGEEVTVSFKGQSVRTKAANGEWMVTLKAMPADAKGSELKVQGKNLIRVKNVVTGDIWICSGQSNMEWPMRSTHLASKDIAKAKYPALRLFDGRVKKASGSRWSNIPGKKWTPCTPRVLSPFSATGFYFGYNLHKELNVPVGLISVNWGGTRIEPWISIAGYAGRPAFSRIYAQLRQRVAGTPENKAAYTALISNMEKWSAAAREAVKNGKAVPDLPQVPAGLRVTSHQQPEVLFNSMIAPLCRMAVKGAIWYQGCSNMSDGPHYREKMHMLINSWRKEFNMPEMPLYFVQLAPYNYRDPYRLPVFWEAQQKFADEAKNVKMAVINDIGNFRNIHPANKSDVGRRLALLALKYTYGKKDLAADSPRYDSFDIDGSKVTVTFRNAVKLKTSDGKPARYFEIAGADGMFHPAEAKLEGRKAVLSSSKVAKPYMVRFAWHHNVTVNLVNEAGLPAGAFRDSKPIPLRNDFDRLVKDNKKYQLIYAVSAQDIMKDGKFAYLEDNAAKFKGRKIKKVGYFMFLNDKSGSRYVFATISPFTQDLVKLGLPKGGKDHTFRQIVKDLTVQSNVPGVKNGSFADGNVEFWAANYSGTPSLKLPGATTEYDFDDTPSGFGVGYGSFQLHNYREKQTVFALNSFSSRTPDVGIGNSLRGKKDYTFARNAGRYSRAYLLILAELE